MSQLTSAIDSKPDREGRTFTKVQGRLGETRLRLGAFQRRRPGAPKDFLPELPEERARREAEEEEARKAPVNAEQFASFKERRAGLTKKKF
jgi:hypothetical protein